MERLPSKWYPPQSGHSLAALASHICLTGNSFTLTERVIISTPLPTGELCQQHFICSSQFGCCVNNIFSWGNWMPLKGGHFQFEYSERYCEASILCYFYSGLHRKDMKSCNTRFVHVGRNAWNSAVRNSSRDDRGREKNNTVCYVIFVFSRCANLEMLCADRHVFYTHWRSVHK